MYFTPLILDRKRFDVAAAGRLTLPALGPRVRSRVLNLQQLQQGRCSLIVVRLPEIRDRTVAGKR